MKYSSLLILLLVNCSTPNTKTVNAPIVDLVSSDFFDLLDSLPKINTPIEFNSRATSNTKAKLHDMPMELLEYDSQLEKMKLIGVLNIDSGYASILFKTLAANGSPLLATYDSEGNRKSEKLLFTSAIGDMGYYVENYVIFYGSEYFTITDSVLIRKLNKTQDDEIPGTDSTYAIVKEFNIDMSGLVLEK